MPEQIDSLIEQLNEPIDSNLLKNLESLWIKKFKRFLAKRSLQATGFLGPQGLYLKLILGTPEKAHVFELYTSLQSVSKSQTDLMILIDYLDGVLEEFFPHEGENWLPLDFALRQFEKKPLYVRHRYRNFDLEKQADELLKKST